LIIISLLVYADTGNFLPPKMIFHSIRSCRVLCQSLSIKGRHIGGIFPYRPQSVALSSGRSARSPFVSLTLGEWTVRKFCYWRARCSGLYENARQGRNVL